MNTRIHFLYRDAANYKIPNDCVIRGEITPEQIEKIADALLDGEFFKPEMVGLHGTTFTDLGYRPCDDDPDFFELGEYGDFSDAFTLTDESWDVNITPEQLVENFMLAHKNGWQSEDGAPAEADAGPEGKRSRVKIYQIDASRDVNRVKFLGSDLLEKFQQSDKVDPSIYNEVFNAEIDESDMEEIYARFNTEGHPLHRGHSLSVSDVVVTENGAFFCDSVGFKQIEFDESETRKPDNLMRVVYVEPHKPPYIAEIEHTLEAEQKAVCGWIEPVYNDDDTCLIGNEESKLIGMEGNRHMDGGGIIAGPFFVCGLTEDDFRGLTDAEAEKYMARFAEPEDISPEEVQADTGFFIGYW